MPTLGELLSEFSDIKSSDVVVEPGLVFKIFDTRTNPPKIKYHVVVGVCEEDVLVGTVRINTSMNVNVHRTMEAQYRCIKLKQEVYNFLDHDSIVDCNLLIPSPLPKIQWMLDHHPQYVIGKLLAVDIEEIKLRMIDAPTISREDKIKFGIVQN